MDFRSRRRFSLWTLIFAITFAFQLFRGEHTDALIFGISTLVMLLQPLEVLSRFSIPALRLRAREIWFLAIFGGLVISYIPRHHVLLATLFIAFAPVLFLSLWGAPNRHIRLSKLERNSSIFWAVTALVVSLWELTALVVANIKNNDLAYPTISELVVPALATPITRIEFVVMWILMGWLVVRHWSHK